MEDLTGRQLGAYQIVAPLGEGGMAAVYKAYQPAMERYVALKILPRHFASDPQFIARFRQEGKVLAQLQHPHILPVFDSGEAEGYTYLVMPFIATGTLAQRLTGSPLPPGRTRRIVSQIGEALDYAHARGLLHRDVKPSNVLIDERDNCLLSDFGLAKIMEGAVDLTSQGGILGTPTYMSPEQGRGEKLDGRSDIYALGVILYELATGRPPYRAETPMAVVVKHINDPLPLPRTVNPAVPEALERVILKALAKNPAERYATAADLVRALQTAVPESGAAEVPAPGGPAEATQVHRQPRQLAAGGAALIALALLAGLAGWAVLHPGILNSRPPAASPSPAASASTATTASTAGGPTGAASSGATPVNLQPPTVFSRGTPLLLEDFGSLEAARWRTGGRVAANNGVLEITAGEQDTFLRRAAAFPEGEAAFLAFRFEGAQPRFNIYIWDEGNRQLGLHYDPAETDWAVYQDAILSKTDFSGLQPGRWYDLLLRMRTNNQIEAQVWERDSGAPVASLDRVMAANWGGRAWKFAAQVFAGSLAADEYEEVRFP